MAAKKKPAKKPQRKLKLSQAEQMVEQLATDLQRVLAERDAARKDAEEARRGREAWCHKAIECEEKAERAETALRDVLAGIVTPRPSVPTPGVNCVGLTAAEQLMGATPVPAPAPTFGLPGDAPLPNPSRFSREFRP